MPQITLDIPTDAFNTLTTHWGYDVSDGPRGAWGKQYFIARLKHEHRFAKQQLHDDSFIAPVDPDIT